jgi:hypothetical protein
MALRTLNEFINAFSISISISGVDQSLVFDQQKMIDRSKSISISNRSRSAIDRGKSGAAWGGGRSPPHLSHILFSKMNRVPNRKLRLGTRFQFI